MVATLLGHWAAVNDLCWAHGNEYIVSASTDCSVIVWDVGARELFHVCLGHTKPVLAVGLDASLKYIVSAGEDCSIIIWSWEIAVRDPSEGSSAALIRTLQQPPPGKKKSRRPVAIADDPTTAEAQQELEPEPELGHTGPVRSIVVDRTARYFISASDDGSVCIWNFRGKRLAQLNETHIDDVFCVRVNANRKMLASAARDKTLAIYQLGATTREMHTTNCMFVM